MNLSSDSHAKLEQTATRSEDLGCKLCLRKVNGRKCSLHFTFECNDEELLRKEGSFPSIDKKEQIAEVARKLAEIGDSVYNCSSNTIFDRALRWITRVFGHQTPDNFLHRRLTRLRLLDMEHGVEELPNPNKVKIFARQLALIADILDQQKGRYA